MNKVLVLAAAGLLLGGCARKAVPTMSGAGAGTAVRIEPAVKAVNSAFPYLSAKGKVQVDMNGNKQGANVSLRMRRDSIIWLSASLLGFEGVRAKLTPDSVIVVNRLQKEYFAGGYDYLSRLLNVPVSFTQMQALLLGDYLPAPAGTKLSVSDEAGEQQRIAYQDNGLLIARLLQAGTGRVQQLRMEDPDAQRTLTVDYTDFQPLDGEANFPFAHTSQILAQDAEGTVSAALNYSKVSVGREKLSFPFSVPAGYARRDK